jgi:protein SCO1/2
MTTVDEVLALVEAVKQEPSRRAALVEFLRDEHAIHRDRGAADVVRLRGFVMQAFSDVGLPEEALPFVLEDLESSLDAYAVAAAARALRGWASPSLDLRPVLLRALENVAGTDEYVSFAAYAAVGEPGTGTTAAAEIQATLRWLNVVTDPSGSDSNEDGRETTAHPGCCCGSARAQVVTRFEEGRRTPSDIMRLEFEDHDGRTISFGEMFTGRPSIVVFFYTRCENPRKCSLTIEKLGRLQGNLESLGLAEGVRIAAITYDPEFDSPSRLKRYAIARRFQPSEDHRLLRAKAGMAALQDFFSLGVNFVHSIVNRHRVELYLLDRRARMAASFVRLEWQEQEVLDELRRVLDSPARGQRPSRTS